MMVARQGRATPQPIRWPRIHRGGAMPVDFSSASGRKQMRDTWQSKALGLVRSYERTFAKAGNMLPVRPLGGVDSNKDRFLTELSARADELRDQLLGSMRDRAASG